MKFKLLVAILLGAIAYGVLYSDLPCWAQLGTQSLECQTDAYERALRLQIQKADRDHPGWRTGR